MGSGKTAVGRQLSRELNMEFLDIDEEIQKRTGVDIRFIFEKEWENRFREREKALIIELTQLNNIVLATGGGSILDTQNREHLSAHGIVVYLKTSVKQQLYRTRNTNSRPLLMNDNPENVLAKLMKTRGPLYEKIANISVNTGGKKVKTVVGHIKTSLQEKNLI